MSLFLFGKHGSILLIGKAIVFYKEKEAGDGENEKAITHWNRRYNCLQRDGGRTEPGTASGGNREFRSGGAKSLRNRGFAALQH